MKVDSKNDSYTQQILNVKHSVKYFRHQIHFDGHYVIKFISIKEAYNRIDWESLFKVMTEFGLD